MRLKIKINHDIRDIFVVRSCSRYVITSALIVHNVFFTINAEALLLLQQTDLGRNPFKNDGLQLYPPLTSDQRDSSQTPASMSTVHGHRGPGPGEPPSSASPETRPRAVDSCNSD